MWVRTRIFVWGICPKAEHCLQFGQRSTALPPPWTLVTLHFQYEFASFAESLHWPKTINNSFCCAILGGDSQLWYVWIQFILGKLINLGPHALAGESLNGRCGPNVTCGPRPSIRSFPTIHWEGPHRPQCNVRQVRCPSVLWDFSRRSFSAASDGATHYLPGCTAVLPITWGVLICVGPQTGACHAHSES